MSTIKNQWIKMLENGTLPVLEYETKEGDYVVVDLSFSENDIIFNFDQDDKNVYFDGEIKEMGSGVFRLPFDQYFDSLDYYLQLIDQNIIEGFLIPNDLYK